MAHPEPADASGRRPVFEVRGLTKVYDMGEVQVQAMRGVDLDLFDGEFVVLLGPSGSGKSPLLVVHGANDSLIKPELGRRLFEAALGPKAFVLVPGGSHHNTNAVGQSLYRDALAQLFELP